MIQMIVVSKPYLFTLSIATLALSCSSPGSVQSLDDGDTEELTLGSGGAPVGAGGGQTGGAENASGGRIIAGSGGIDAYDASGGTAPSSSGGTANDEQTGGSGGSDTGTGGINAGAGGSDPGNGCPFSGSVHYQLNNSDTWPEDVVVLIQAAMDEATDYYNCYADLSKSITVNYEPGVPTAEANVDGWLSFGADKGYMQTATAMHEVAHTLGVGYSPWSELMESGRWIGPHVVQLIGSIPAEERDADEYSQRTYITGDSQHFWPYGLNQAAEHQSEWSLIDHVRLVAAMQLDKEAYIAGEL